MVERIVVVGARTCCELLLNMCDLKAAHDKRVTLSNLGTYASRVRTR